MKKAMLWYSYLFRTHCRNGAAQVQTLLMFAMLVAFLPFAFGVEAGQLQNIAIAFMWFEALIIQILAMPNLFQTDFEDGTIELMFASPIFLLKYALTKILIFWLFYGFALACSTLVLSVLFNVSFTQIWALFISLSLGSLALSMLIAIGAALNLALEKGGTVSIMLMLPLSVPILIFGVAAAQQSNFFEAEYLGLFGLFLLYSALSIITVPVLLRTMVSR